jgi:mannosyltransferase OCH1-like enzyme
MTFKDLMVSSSGYTQDKILSSEWEIIEKLFDNRSSVGASKIPKIIHQIWLGGNLDDNLLKCIESVKNANPGYNHMLWTDSTVEEFDFKNKDLFLKCKNKGQKSDILRYALLEKFGGIYLDTDFIGIKNFDSLLHNSFFTGVSYDNEPTLFNGLIGCEPNHNLIKDLNNFDGDISDYDGMAIIRTTGPWYLTRKLFRYVKKDNKDVIVMPVVYFYPFPNFNRDKIAGNEYKNYVTPETICVHLWDSRWN